MTFKECIKYVGTGIKGNKDLSYEMMSFAMDAILNQKMTNAQIGAFLVGLRVKLESDEELLSAYDVLHKSITLENIPQSIEIGYPGDGKNKTPYLFYLSAKDLPDTTLIVNDGLKKPAKDGILLSELKEFIEMPENIYFFDLKRNAQKYEALTSIRKELGLRTIFNTIERLLGGTQSRFGIVGMFHNTYFHKYKMLYANRYERLVIVQGDEGTPEIAKNCKIMVVDDGEIVNEIKIKLSDFGIDYERAKENISKEKMADDLLNPNSEFKKLAKLNTALLMLASKQTDDIKNFYEDFLI